MMAKDLARALDPVLIASDCGISLDDWQADLMRSTASRVLLLCARQTGKSTVSGLIGKPMTQSTSVATMATKSLVFNDLIDSRERRSRPA